MIANANQIVVPKSESNKRHLQSHPLQRSNSNGSKRSNQKKKKKKNQLSKHTDQLLGQRLREGDKSHKTRPTFPLHFFNLNHYY